MSLMALAALIRPRSANTHNPAVLVQRYVYLAMNEFDITTAIQRTTMYHTCSMQGNLDELETSANYNVLLYN
jgi:hypothetical protein